MLYNEIDFRTQASSSDTTGDTGEPEAAAIRQISDGEPAGQAVFRRPTENTRYRSDILRRVVREHTILQDFQQSLLQGGGTITFNKTVAGGGDGKFTITADLQVRPFATPGADTSPYTASTKASLVVGSDGTSVIKFTSQAEQWHRLGGAYPDIAAEADMISVEIVHTGALSVDVRGAVQPNNLYITINYGTTTVADVISAVNAHSTANKLVVASLDAGDGTDHINQFTTTQWGTDWTARYLRNGAPGLLHTISSGVLNSFFGTPANCLAKGDTLAISYAALIDLASIAAGGRLQSTPENGNYQLTAASLFNTRREPGKIPNCIPICKCVDDNTLIFVDGSRIIYGTPASLWWDSQHILSSGSSPIDYSAWTRLRYAPGAHVPPTTVQQAFDNTDDFLEAILNGSQAFVATTGNRGVTATGDGANEGIRGTGGPSNGVGVIGNAGGGNASGGRFIGAGTGEGVYGLGGSTSGVGILGVGGAADGIGVVGQGAGAGDGVHGDGGVSGVGVSGYSRSAAAGVTGTSEAGDGVVGLSSGGSGRGVVGTSSVNYGVLGQSSYAGGAGVCGKGTANNACGVEGVGDGSGSGVKGTGGASGSYGVEGIGGGTFGKGGHFEGGGDVTSGGIGVEGYGHGTSPGVYAHGDINSTTALTAETSNPLGRGIGASGGGNGGIGIDAGAGGNNSIGGYFHVDSGNGTGVSAVGSGNKPGLYAQGGASAGVGVYAVPGTGGVGVQSSNYAFDQVQDIYIPVMMQQAVGYAGSGAGGVQWTYDLGADCWHYVLPGSSNQGSLLFACYLPDRFKLYTIYVAWRTVISPVQAPMSLTAKLLSYNIGGTIDITDLGFVNHPNDSNQLVWTTWNLATPTNFRLQHGGYVNTLRLQLTSSSSGGGSDDYIYAIIVRGYMPGPCTFSSPVSAP